MSCTGLQGCALGTLLMTDTPPFKSTTIDSRLVCQDKKVKYWRQSLFAQSSKTTVTFNPIIQVLGPSESNRTGLVDMGTTQNRQHGKNKKGTFQWIIAKSS